MFLKITALVVLGGFCIVPLAAQPARKFVPGRLLVKFRPGVGQSQSDQLLASLQSRRAREISGASVHVIDLPARANEAAFLNVFKNRPEVEFAELDELVEPADLTPNDPWYANWEWHLKKIQAPAAWSTTTGVSSVIIAIL